jgi:hypothetical protein
MALLFHNTPSVIVFSSICGMLSADQRGVLVLEKARRTSEELGRHQP